jgi:hypothetical protein
VQWQYTSTPIDMNAFRGTVADFIALVGGGTFMALTSDQQDDMYRRICNMDSFAYYGSVLGQDTIPASQLSYGLPPNNHAPEQDQPYALNQALKDVQEKVAALAAAVAALQTGGVDVTALATQVATLLPAAPTAAEVAKAVNDDSAARMRE